MLTTPFSLYRASYFTPTPTGKMYAVVAAAKALYDQLGEMGESSIDGDSFLDLWIYVIIKAGVKDLVSHLEIKKDVAVKKFTVHLEFS